MTIFHLTDQAGRALGLVRVPHGDESAARGLMAGKGKARDERFVGHDGGVACSALDPDGPAGVLWRAEAATEAAPAVAEDQHVAGQRPDNRGSA